MQLRKARRRVAQRSYRSRKQAAAVAPSTPAAPREAPLLDRALQSVHVLQDYLSLSNHDSAPAHMASELSRTAMELATIAQQARSSNRTASKVEPVVESPRDEKPTVSVLERFSDTALARFPKFSPAGQVIFDVSSLPQNVQREGRDVTSLTYRIVRACFVRSIAAMSYDALPDGWTPSPLLLPLRIGGTEILVGLSVAQMQDLSDGYWGDARYDQKTLNAMPRMFRIIEGDRSGAVPREAPPKLQRLQYGRTRTILQTTLPDMQHEFLEASDVEEYLEERGIVVRGAEDVVELALPTDETSRDDGHEIADWTIFGQQSVSGQTIPSGLWTFTPSLEQYAMLAQGQQLLNSGVPDQVGAISPASKVTLSLDKLVNNLVAHANCLGPAPGIRKVSVDLAISESVIAMKG